jgi:hypothetical protein
MCMSGNRGEEEGEGEKKNEAQHWLCTLTGIVQDYTPVGKEVPQPADAFYCAERGERVLGSGGA